MGKRRFPSIIPLPARTSHTPTGKVPLANISLPVNQQQHAVLSGIVRPLVAGDRLSAPQSFFYCVRITKSK